MDLAPERINTRLVDILARIHHERITGRRHGRPPPETASRPQVYGFLASVVSTELADRRPRCSLSPTRQSATDAVNPCISETSTADCAKQRGILLEHLEFPTKDVPTRNSSVIPDFVRKPRATLNKILGLPNTLKLQ